VKYSKKRPKIARGVSPENLRFHYSVPELQAFMEENGLKKNGKKSVLIKRILAWLDGDKENTMADANTGKKRRGGRRKSLASKKKRSPKRAKKVEPVVEEESEEGEILFMVYLFLFFFFFAEEEEMELESEDEEELESGETEDIQVDVSEDEESEDEEEEDEEEGSEEEAVEEEDGEVAEVDISGKQVAVLGNFENMKISEITAQLKAEGATVSRKVTEDTYFVIQGDKNVKASELKKAQKRGINIVGSEFFEADGEESEEEESEEEE